MSDGSKFWKWAVMLLVFCNIGLMLLLWLKPHRENGPPVLRGMSPRDYVVQQLKFTDDQVKKYDLLIKDHQDAMHELRNEAKTYREQLFANLKGNNGGNSRFADSMSRLIGNNQAQIELATYNHFAKVRALCTEAQQAEFDLIIVEVTKKMSGHGGPPPRNDEGPGPAPGDDGNRPPPPGNRQGPPPGPDGNPPPPGDR